MLLALSTISMEYSGITNQKSIPGISKWPCKLWVAAGGIGKEWIGWICSNVEGAVGESEKVQETKRPVRRLWKDSRDKSVDAADVGA